MYLPFLRTLCARPDLAKHVKFVDLLYWWTEIHIVTGGYGPLEMEWEDFVMLSEKAVEMRIISRVTLRQFRKQIRSQNDLVSLYEKSPFTAIDTETWPNVLPAISTKLDWLRNLGMATDDAQVILMLSLLPNLTCLRLFDTQNYSRLPWTNMIENSPHGFKKLQKFKGYQIQDSIFAELLQLPTLRKIVAYGISDSCDDSDDPPWPWHCIEGTSNVEVMELDGAYLHTTTMERLLKSCASLKVFQYKVTTIVEPQLTNHKTIIPMLDHHRSSLEWVTMEFRPRLGHGVEEDNTSLAQLYTGDRALANFKALKCLDVDSELIIDASDPAPDCLIKNLPSNLVALALTFRKVPEKQHHRCFESFALSVDNSHTKLREIFIRTYPEEHAKEGKDFVSLIARMFEMKGVSV
ncbi:hypothetical protein EJ08DRAFT_51981 [Tothia fuscella]|uniref:Uncharacterized protein n=1 Tax=Tothia fuscella TaxID=1048955 RepID=A0A9P4NF56_9PEZI|nr:hypothetical protein EJ08DRAFT_51981 [Tothia fuscella]